MADEADQSQSSLLRRGSDLGGVAGLVGLLITGLLWFLSQPGWLVLAVGCFSLGATCVGILGHVFLSNNQPLVRLGDLGINPTLVRGAVPPPRSLPEEAKEQRQVSLEELEEKYEPLKKLKPNFVDLGNELVEAHNDEKGVIVRGSSPDRESFHALVRSFGNEHPRNKVRSLQRVSFRLKFICFDRATRHKYAGVDIHRGAWLTEAETELDFPAHCPPRRAVIVTTEGSDNRVYVVRRDSDSSYKNILPLREELTGSIYTVFVSLLVESRNSKTFQYILEVIREPNFELYLNDANHWKVGHLHRFTREGIAFLERLSEIADVARAQVPMNNTPPPSLSNWLLSSSSPPDRIDYFDSIARIQAIEQEQEEQLLDEIKEWGARAADWVDLFIGAGERDNFIKSEPSIEDGFKRVKKHVFHRIQLASPKGESPRPSTLPYWKLSDAVNSRIDKLMKMTEQLR